jgi:hypothetical protein
VLFQVLIYLISRNKKREIACGDCCFYGRLLIIVASIAPTIAIAMIIAIVEMAKYVSVGGCACAGFGDAVAAGSVAWKAVAADDG